MSIENVLMEGDNAVPKQPAYVEAVINVLLELAFFPDGFTAEQRVRIPTTAAPVYGGIGGKLATFGGRQRFSKENCPIRVTVGKGTTNVYRVVNKQTEFIANLKTKEIDLDAFRQLLSSTV